VKTKEVFGNIIQIFDNKIPYIINPVLAIICNTIKYNDKPCADFDLIVDITCANGVIANNIDDTIPI